MLLDKYRWQILRAISTVCVWHAAHKRHGSRKDIKQIMKIGRRVPKPSFQCWCYEAIEFQIEMKQGANFNLAKGPWCIVHRLRQYGKV